MTTTQKAVLLHPMGSMGEAIADDCYAGPYPLEPHQWPPVVADGWVGRSIIDMPEYRAAQAEANLRARNLLDSQEVADLLEIERINLTGARYRESVRLEKHGELPWDFAAGESA